VELHTVVVVADHGGGGVGGSVGSDGVMVVARELPCTGPESWQNHPCAVQNRGGAQEVYRVKGLGWLFESFLSCIIIKHGVAFVV